METSGLKRSANSDGFDSQNRVLEIANALLFVGLVFVRSVLGVSGRSQPGDWKALQLGDSALKLSAERLDVLRGIAACAKCVPNLAGRKPCQKAAHPNRILNRNVVTEP